ncbi:MAG TPA: DNA-directed RNA polymerase subunit H [Candidatus Nanoarchaeia archaeon]|nr:DNA-directed RNA polymerase subunit H [Candidatus Nanoarchaeia archaeon]
MTTKPKISIAKHILVPKHTKLSEKEKAELFSRYGITLRELPKILRNDPAIAELDVKTGDVIKVHRKSPTAGDSVFYRGVIDA